MPTMHLTYLHLYNLFAYLDNAAFKVTNTEYYKTNYIQTEHFGNIIAETFQCNNISEKDITLSFPTLSTDSISK